MNFLAEVIASAEQGQMDKISESVPNIKFKIDQHEREVAKFVDTSYKNYEDTNISNLLRQSEKLTGDMSNLKKQVNDATALNKKSNDTMKKLSNTVKEADITLTFTRTLIEVHCQLEEVKKEFCNNRFKEALEILRNLKQNLDKLPEETMADFIFPHVLKTETLFFNKLLEICTENITMTVQETITNKIVALSISSIKRFQCLESMHVLGCNESFSSPIFHDLNDFILEQMIKPIFSKKLAITFNENSQEVILNVVIQDATEKPCYVNVFDSLKQILSQLRKMLSAEDDTCPLMLLIGNRNASKVQSLLIKECLADVIPSSAEDLEEFDNIIKEVEEFETYLIEVGFFGSNSTALTEYVKDVDSLFLDKKCQKLFEKAMELMKKDLHNTVEISQLGEDTDDKHTGFSRCHISRSCVELVELIKSLLLEYADNDKKHSEKLTEKIYSTIDAILYQYPNAVKTHHAKLLESIPQQSALFHNNCLYLAHVITFDASLQSLNKLKMERHVNQLTVVGNHIFELFVEEQQKQIEHIINNCELSELQTADALNANVEKSIRQCLRQQELLKTVWQKILSYEVYNETLGRLLSDFCNCLINKVIVVSDISSTCAEQLVDIFNVVATRGPKLLSDPKEINMYVEHWNKFKQLILILSSSLLEIGDQWANGKGPLALYFAAHEVKQLIRAIFQNTERRRNILAQIL